MTKKLKGFNHWGWGIAGVLTMIIVTGLVGAGILNSMANDPAFKNMTCTQCEPGMNPWVFQHPLMFLGILGCVALVSGINHINHIHGKDWKSSKEVDGVNIPTLKGGALRQSH